MYCVRRVTEDVCWVGGDDRRLAMFEGVYSVPGGVSYNSYLLKDESTVLFDTVDKAVERVFFENLEYALEGRALDFVVVQHMEPDHSAALLEVLRRWPEATVVCTARTAGMIEQFFGLKVDERAYIVKEGSKLNTGRHEFTFVMAPMVHWPEVMMSYDAADGLLFSADAFGCFGALGGALFADEVDFERDYMDEARRYYTNIVGKYGAQVQAVLKKAAGLDVRMICPLHGFVWRKDIALFVDKYDRWSSYRPEEAGVMLAYASIYGGTANTVEALACMLRERGVKTQVFDVSVTPASDIIAAAFRFSHLVFASPTYNNGIFVTMEALLHDLAAHNLQNRAVALIENGSWAPASGKLMRALLEPLRGVSFVGDMLTVKSAPKQAQRAELETLADLLAAGVAQAGAAAAPAVKAPAQPAAVSAQADAAAFHKLTYGLFVLTAREGERDNGCIINTAQQVTDDPKRISIAVNKSGLTHEMIARTGVFNVTVLSQDAPFKVFEHFGYHSGREGDKFVGCGDARTGNGVRYIPNYSCAVISCRVAEAVDCGTHTLFIADVTEARVLADGAAMTYAHYFAAVKPKPQAQPEKKGWVCRICGYVHEGEELPADFVCPICKHGASDFEPLG